MEQLMYNPVVWILLALCTFVGLPSFIYTIHSRHVDKKKRELSATSNSNNIVKQGKSSIDKLKLTFDGKPIEELTMTKIALWNSGCEEIRREDIASDSRLCIKCNDGTEILDAEIIFESDTTNNFSIVTIESNKVTFDFEYVDKKSGIVVQVAHTGNESDLFVDVKIKGGKSIHYYNNNGLLGKKFNSKKKETSKSKVIIFMTCYLCFNIAFLLYMTTYAILSIWEFITIDKIPGNNHSSGGIVSKILSTIVISFLTILAIFLFVLYIRRTFRTYIPSSLRKQI